MPLGMPGGAQGSLGVAVSSWHSGVRPECIPATVTACWVLVAMALVVRVHTPRGCFWRGLDGGLIGAAECGPPAHTFAGVSQAQMGLR